MQELPIDDGDWLDDVPNAPSSERLTDLTALFRVRQGIVDEIEDLEAQLTVKKEELRQLDEVRFPKLLDDAGVESFTVPSNKGEGTLKITVQEKLYGSLPKDPEERQVAMKELVRLKADGIFKAEVTAPFGKGQVEQARKVVELLKSNGVVAKLEETVHAQTLQAWAREQLRNGVVVDLDKLGLYNRRFITVK